MFNFLPDELPNENNALLDVAEKVAVLEHKLATFKELEKQYKEAKQELFYKMKEAGVKNWKLSNGVTFTLVDDRPDEFQDVETFDEVEFKKQYNDLYNAFLKTKRVIKSGRAGYVRVNIKEAKND